MSEVLRSDPLPASVRDEREVMAKTAGVLWLLACTVTLAGQLFPSAPHEHLGVLLLLFVPIGLHAIACLTGVGWTRASLTQHAIGSVVLFPLIGVAIWATGGADSYIRPMILLAAMFTGYFFPPPWRWVLVAELILVVSSPLLYEPDFASVHHFAPSLLAFAAACVAMTVAVARLKRRLVDAERFQQVRALRDPLTGVRNRRAFDEQLAAAVERGDPFALLFADLDDFKSINDQYGHQEGDRVLCDVAARCDAVVRAGDCLARIGGDEFVVLAFDAGLAGERRIATELEKAIASVTYGDGATLSATVTAARHPDDGASPDALMAAVDGRLHERKRARRSVSLIAG